VFEDGGVSLDWKRIYDNPADAEGARRAYKNYRKEKGIVEELEL